MAGQDAYTEIGAFEAKSKLSEILRKVERGERFTITVRGRAVADVIPSRGRDQARIAQAVRELENMPKIQGISGETIKQWIEAGRE